MKTFLLLLVVQTLAWGAAAGGTLYPKLILHLVPAAGTPGDCSAAPASPACNGNDDPDPNQVPVRTEGDLLVEYRMFAILADVDSASGVSGIRFGVESESGVSISSWQVCDPGWLSFPSAGWPGSGSDITILFDLVECVRPTPDPYDFDHRGVIPLVMFNVTASEPSLFEIVRPAQGGIQISDCARTSSELSSNFGYGQVGFGYKIGWDPCGSDPYGDDPCVAFYDCVCCGPASCFTMGNIYSTRACINDGGKPLPGSDCSVCQSPARPMTWGLLKVRYH